MTWPYFSDEPAGPLAQLVGDVCLGLLIGLLVAMAGILLAGSMELAAVLAAAGL